MKVTNLLRKYPLNSNMISFVQLKTLLQNLANVIEKNIDGDVVELGCNQGGTSLYLSRLLNALKSEKKLYLYDSFEGLPEMSIQDKSEHSSKIGKMEASFKTLINMFDYERLPKPNVYKCLFNEITNDYCPNKIAFAFFDGDLYNSILDSFNIMYEKVSINGIICVHDYNWPPLPGVKIACDEFLSDKLVDTTYNDYILTIIKKDK